MKHYAIIVAGGSGSRIIGDIPKQFMLLGGLPVLIHTISRFSKADPDAEIIVVLPGKEISRWKNLCDEFSFTVKHQIAEGGSTRFHSVKNGLNFVTEKSVVAIHDGARPFASPDLIIHCFQAAEKTGSAVPFIPLNESIREIYGNQSKVVNRNSFVIVQTPQCFQSDILKNAYESDYQDTFTDDASVVETKGISIQLIIGEKENLKITYSSDFIIAEALLKNYLR
jgi:2-C-methyl-D-erythritol 4-phosphate cytidylyltransferase